MIMYAVLMSNSDRSWIPAVVEWICTAFGPIRGIYDGVTMGAPYPGQEAFCQLVQSKTKCKELESIDALLADNRDITIELHNGGRWKHDAICVDAPIDTLDKLSLYREKAPAVYVVTRAAKTYYLSDTCPDALHEYYSRFIIRSFQLSHGPSHLLNWPRGALSSTLADRDWDIIADELYKAGWSIYEDYDGVDNKAMWTISACKDRLEYVAHSFFSKLPAYEEIRRLTQHHDSVFGRGRN